MGPRARRGGDCGGVGGGVGVQGERSVDGGVEGGAEVYGGEFGGSDVSGGVGGGGGGGVLLVGAVGQVYDRGCR